MEATMLASELYGVWAHSFTGASSNSMAGIAERAHRGPLFLDEIANMPRTAQAELLEFGRLRADGMRTLKRLGNFPKTTQGRRSVLGEFDEATEQIAVDVFLIAATNQRIQDEEYRRQIGFLDDLWDRLVEYNRFIRFPSLNERREDIAFLFSEFLEEETVRIGGRLPKLFDIQVNNCLTSHDWRGNVSELKGIAMEVANNSRDWNEILERHLPHQLIGSDEKRATVSIPSPPQPFAPAVPAQAHLGKSPRETLDGALERLSSRYGMEAELLIEAALDLTRQPHGRVHNDLLGDLRPTSALQILLGRKMKIWQAADILKRIFELSGTVPAPGSYTERALAYARARRPGGSNVNKRDDE